MNIAADRIITKLAHEQAGVVTRAQALEAGLHSATVSRRVANGLWRSPFRGIYVVAPWPDPRLQRVLAAVLAAGAGAVASHDTTLWLHGLRTNGRSAIHITTPSRKPRRVGPDVVVHTTRSLEPFEVVEARAVRSTDVARALVDVAWTHRRELERLVFDALRERLASSDAVRERLDRLAARQGAAHLRELLDAAEAAGADRLRSAAEALAARIFRQHDLHLEAGYCVVERGVRLAELDFADPDARVAVEIDGYRFHATPAEKRYDDRRQNLLASRGWTVLRFTYADLSERPAAVVAEIRRTIARVSAQR